MITNIDSMPDSARLWVYQAERKLTPEEVTLAGIQTENFLNQWAAHGHELKSAFEIRHDQFLVITVDESLNGASGCSIDACVGMVRTLENELGISFLDRSKVAILKNDEIHLVPFNGVKSLIDNGEILPETQVINNSVSSFGDWKKSWLQKASDSWMSRFF